MSGLIAIDIEQADDLTLDRATSLEEVCIKQGIRARNMPMTLAKLFNHKSFDIK